LISTTRLDDRQASPTRPRRGHVGRAEGGGALRVRVGHHRRRGDQLAPAQPHAHPRLDRRHLDATGQHRAVLDRGVGQRERHTAGPAADVERQRLAIARLLLAKPRVVLDGRYAELHHTQFDQPTVPA
jgi:hypothetical protein